jgi:GDP-L-fucose synthase
LREFIHVDDIASATVFVMGLDFSSLYELGITQLNVGTGEEISIRELAELISGIVGFSGDLVFDQSMPDGTPRKLVDVSRINQLGWKHKIDLEEGLAMTYALFANNRENKSITENSTL